VDAFRRHTPNMFLRVEGEVLQLSRQHHERSQLCNAILREVDRRLQSHDPAVVMLHLAEVGTIVALNPHKLHQHMPAVGLLQYHGTLR
jgi:hypothetical protein